jgi:hypothetical protein
MSGEHGPLEWGVVILGCLYFIFTIIRLVVIQSIHRRYMAIKYGYKSLTDIEATILIKRAWDFFAMFPFYLKIPHEDAHSLELRDLGDKRNNQAIIFLVMFMGAILIALIHVLTDGWILGLIRKIDQWLVN